MPADLARPATDRSRNRCGMTTAGRRRIPPFERFWPKVIKAAPDACWLWTGGTSHGYGVFWDGQKYVKAHRFSWELAHGRPIPDGLTIDHLCKVTLCVNPAHMEPVTIAENLARSDRSRPRNGDHNRRKTHCVYGHPFDESNTLRDKHGHRECLACRRRKNERRRELRRARNKPVQRLDIGPEQAA